MDPSTTTGEQNIPTMAGSISEMPDPNSGDDNVGEYDMPTTSGQNIDDKKIPKIGMIFDSVEEAKTFYNAYAKLVGFGIRTQSNRKNKRSKEEYVSSLFVCSNEGFKRIVGQHQFERPATRTGCNARMGVRRAEGGKYVVYKVEFVHNHEVSPSTVSFYRSHKKMDTGVRKVIRQNGQAGIRTHKSIQSLAVEVGGVTNLEFEERDVRNFIAKQRRMELKDGDAQALYTYFCEMQQKYPGFYYTVNVDEESRLILLAETEISLFKQEKLRLQSQLEGALKASDNAQSLLRAERASSRAAMFTDEEFKSLKLQVSELNLLRESNMQLREENKYNFEECQKLREIAQKAATETEYLNNLLREREAELDASKKETEMLNIEKRHLESRISELLERAKDIDVDVEDYERIKEDFRQIQLKLLEKETEVEEIKKNINEKQDTIAKLEQELANTHSGYTEAEKRLTSILQSEAMLKTDIEKQKKIISNYKKKTESLTKDKEELMKEKQALSKQIEESSKEKQALSKQIESSIKEKQALSKQIEDLIKEKQTLSKQIEDFRTSKKTIGDTSTEQAMKEKDTRIHMLEKTIEREKARRVKTEDTVVGLVANVRQEKQKMVEELEKHKRARESLLLLESGTSAAQLPSETGLDDQTSAYLLAVDNFEEEAQSILTDVTVSHQSSAETPLVASTSGTIGYQASAQGHVTQPSLMALATNPSQSKPAEEREKQALTARPNLDTRKTGRKLVRPRLERSREQISDVDMLEIEGATTMEEPNAAPSHDPEIQGPLLKKLKGSDSPTAGISTEEQAAQSSEIPEKLPNMEETGDVYLASSEELVDIVKDEEMDNETDPTEELKEPLDSSNQGNLRNDSTAAAELLVEKAIETDEVFDDVSKGLELQDLQYSALEAENETEEGELVLGGTEQQEVSDIPVNVGDSEAGESQTELLDDDVDALAAEVSLGEGKNKSGEVLEEVNEASDKSNNNNGDNNNYKNTVFESKRSPQASFGGGEESSSDVSQNVVSKQATRSPVREREEEKEAPPAGRIVNLGERARENSFLRRAGVMNPILARGRGRAGVAQKRIGRGRGVRGQPPRDQEQ